MSFQFITTNDTKTKQNENPLYRTPQHLIIDTLNYQFGARYSKPNDSVLTPSPEGDNHCSLTEGEIVYIS